MKTHLRILYGADDRFQMVTQTLDVCKDYFDTIRVVNSGPAELAKQFKKIPQNASIETLNFFFGDLESARNAFLYDVDIGDYVLWLDADERPTQHLLNNIDRIIHELEETKFYSARLPSWNHIWDDDGKQVTENWSYEDPLRFPKDAIDYGEKWNANLRKETSVIPVSTTGRFVKKLNPFMSAATNFGGHGHILNHKNVHDMRIVMYPITHLKHDIMHYQSICTCTYVNPCLNAPVKDGYKPYINSVEFKKLREFQTKYGIRTQNDLCWKLHLTPDEEFRGWLKELFLCQEFKDSKLYDNFFKYYHVWADRYNLSWKTPPTFCGKICCRYKHIQL